jgi:hypothetical protein
LLTIYKEIKSTLELNGVRTRRENVYWSLGSLQVMLRNETYLGFDTFVDKKTKLTIKNSVPQLISNKLWMEVQERRKLKLLRKGQINRTTNFYLFRDFLICSCGTPIGGRIKTDKNVRHYYCPLSERKFNKITDDDKTCTMKRCLNIPTTDEVLWKNIIDVLSNSVELKEWMSSKTIMGKGLKSKEMEDIIQNKESKITELTRVKNDLEKGLVKVETEQILNHYPSIEVYKSLKKELTKKYNSTKIEIEELRNSLEQIGNDELWFGWIERFSEEVKDRQDLSDDLKKDFLKLVVKDIVVEYDHTDKVHVLTINFKTPVILRDGNEGLTQSTRVIVTPPKSGRKPSNQSLHVGVYSTVTDLAKFLG